MDISFNKVTYDGELADFSEEELRELVREFESAQESNVAEFETAAEEMTDIDDSTIEDFEAAREEVIEEIVDADTFDEVPLSEAMLEEQDFSDLRDWQNFVQDQAESETDEDNESDGGAEFDDMGKEAPTGGSDDDEDFADEALDNISGLSL